MKTYFLIVNYNDASSVRTLIDNIKDYKVLDKILIVDNKSTDNSLEELKSLKNPKIDVIVTDYNKGYGAGINFGIKYLQKKDENFHIFISNADIIIEKEEDLKGLLKVLEDKNAAVVAPTIVETTRISRGWRLVSPMVEVGLSIPIIYKKIERDYLLYQDNHYKKDIAVVDAVSGAFFLTDARVIEDVGYFDENIFLYYEENVLASKLNNKKMITIVVNKIKVIHNHSVTIDKSLKRYQKYKTLKLSQEYYLKNYKKSSVFTRAVLYIVNRLNFIIRNIVYRIVK